MVNINIEVPDDIHKRAKVAATLADKTLKEFLIEALERRLKELEARR